MTVRTEWLKDRRNYIGASEIATLCGLTSKRPIEVYEFKRGLREEAEQDNALAAFGRDFEPILFAKFEAMTGMRTEASETVYHKEYPFIACNPDRRIVGLNELLEGKTYGFSGASEWGEPGTDHIPLKYRVQTLCQLAITGAERCHVIAFRRETAEYSPYIIERNDELASSLIDKAVAFWIDNVEAGVPPPPDDSDAYRKFLERQFNANPELTIPATYHMDEKIAEAMALAASIKPIEAQLNQIKNEIRAAMGDATRMVSIQGDVTYAMSGKSRALRLPTAS